MILVWTPADAEPRTFTFRPDAMPPAEYEAIEAIGTWPSLTDFDEAIRASSRTAWRAALWICLRREDPALQLDDVQPTPLEVAMDYEPDEELLLAELALADPELPAQQRALYEAALPGIRARAEGKDQPSSDPAPSPTSDTSDAGTSPTTST